MRLVVGASVHTFAKFVAETKTECANVYGRNWKTKTVEGKVEAVDESVRNGRKRRSISGLWAFGTKKRRKTLPLSRVKAHSHPLEAIGIQERQN